MLCLECGVDEALDGLRGSGAAGQFARAHAVAAQSLADAMEEPGVGAAETVDGLFRVAHHVELAGRGLRLAPVALGGVGGGEQEQDLGLQRIGVLELVDEDALVDALQIGARAVVAQQVAGAEQKVHEIELAGAAFFLLIEAHHLPEFVAQAGGEIGIGGLAEGFDRELQLFPARRQRASRPLTQRISVGRRSSSLSMRSASTQPGLAGALHAQDEFAQGAEVLRQLPAARGECAGWLRRYR